MACQIQEKILAFGRWEWGNIANNCVITLRNSGENQGLYRAELSEVNQLSLLFYTAGTAYIRINKLSIRKIMPRLSVC